LKISQLREVFRVAEGHYRRDGNLDSADALSSFSANLLRDDEAATVAAFVKRVEKARKPVVSGARTRRTRPAR
jgi:hypothetical protein